MLDILARQIRPCRDLNGGADSAAAAGDSKVNELGTAPAQPAPTPSNGQRCERSRGEVGAKLLALGTAADEQDGEILDTGVVTDHESRVDAVLQPPQAKEQLLGAGAVELVLDPHLRAPTEAGLDQLKRLPSAERGRTEDHLGGDPVLAEVLGEALRGAASA